MSSTLYSDVVRLADQLTSEEQNLLIEHLRQPRRHELPIQEWEAVFESLRQRRPLAKDYSMRREDWHDDDGR